MASNKDTVKAMEDYSLDAMFIFTVTMGFTAFLMAWTMVVFAARGSIGQGRHEGMAVWNRAVVQRA